MAGLVPAISIGKLPGIQNRDARAKPAHDAVDRCIAGLPSDFIRWLLTLLIASERISL
jgi:hypothetical protein